ncbi:probable pre-mRNA-splicing factor ATP-dependent RNA helicase DEAH5 [Zingiber officinale]|uniref:probable pre-mRNA-splicing factor ATP-dependent RNA helicase DEAH5 n=1 Tax=Zingiber officinale TaxID=94328 RepID=UPI001C4C4800|nr:probable pre-mRNA-splicing factor ATP-dependent RNA helicase DEAH5 [Zingiber officinale]
METGLEYFSWLSNVCQELESHVGSGDKVLAEFITDLCRDSEAVDEFESKLKEFGANAKLGSKVCKILELDPKVLWVLELAPRVYKTLDPTKMSKRKWQERKELLYV